MDALYAEAEGLVRRYWKIQEDLLKSGDFSEVPPEYSEFMADPYLSLMPAVLDYYRTNNLHMAPDATTILVFQPSPGRTAVGSELALQGCADSRNAPLLDAQGNVFSAGAVLVHTYFFKTVDGQLKLYHSEADGEVDQCPSAS